MIGFRIRSSLRGAWLTGLGALVFSSACGAPMDDEGAEHAGSQSQELSTGFKTTDTRFTTPWASPGTVNICFAAPAGNTPDTNLVTEATAAIQTSWAAVTGLTFSFRGTCPTTIPSTWISIFLDTAAGNGVAAMGGVGARLNVSPWANEARVGTRKDMQIYVGKRPGEYRRQVVHEVGHALGFYHEMERSEHRSDSDPNCGLGSNTQGHVTPFDRTSIMLWSYCNNSGRSEEDLLSELDAVGGEMMYPYTTTAHRVRCGARCMESGSGAIVRSDGAVTIDWVRRGAVVATTYTRGTSTFTRADGRLAATDLSSTTSALTMTFKDGYGRANSGSGTVVKSNGWHTALVTTTPVL
jgi:hypothetical protein